MCHGIFLVYSLFLTTENIETIIAPTLYQKVWQPGFGLEVVVCHSCFIVIIKLDSGEITKMYVVCACVFQ